VSGNGVSYGVAAMASFIYPAVPVLVAQECFQP
jgi:hypothetical protein